MARPRKKETLIQTSFRLSASELLEIQEAADAWGVSPSHFIRMSAVSTATASVGKQVATLRDFILDSSEDRGGGAAIPTPDTEN
jgi:uncharacterized protein (DUF1778 family)